MKKFLILAMCLVLLGWNNAFGLEEENKVSDKTAYIEFFNSVDENSVKALINIIEQKLKGGTTKFVILISSPGGNVLSGITAYNFLKGIPAEVETHNFGSVDSIAAVLFCAGNKRFSVPQGKFLLHSPSLTVPKDTLLREKQLQEQLSSLQLDIDTIAGIIAANTTRSKDEIRKIILEGKTFNPDEAKEYGLVHEIKQSLFEKDAELISIDSVIANIKR